MDKEREAGSDTDTSPQDEGLGTDADVMDDSFNGGPKPPEWPSADLDATSDAQAAEAASEAYDDSDAPVVADAAATPQMDAHIRADHVTLSQGGAQTIEAQSVKLSQGGAGQVRADEMTVEQGGVGLARVGNLKLGSGASAFAVLADEATVEEGSTTFLVVSRSLNGDVRPTIDWRTALAFGAGLGLALSILRRLR